VKRQLGALRVTFTPNHPDVKRVESQINLWNPPCRNSAGRLTRIRNEYQGAVPKREATGVLLQQPSRPVSAQATKIGAYNLLNVKWIRHGCCTETMLQN